MFMCTFLFYRFEFGSGIDNSHHCSNFDYSADCLRCTICKNYRKMVLLRLVRNLLNNCLSVYLFLFLRALNADTFCCSYKLQSKASLYILFCFVVEC